MCFKKKVSNCDGDELSCIGERENAATKSPLFESERLQEKSRTKMEGLGGKGRQTAGRGEGREGKGQE